MNALLLYVAVLEWHKIVGVATTCVSCPQSKLHICYYKVAITPSNTTYPE